MDLLDEHALNHLGYDAPVEYELLTISDEKVQKATISAEDLVDRLRREDSGQPPDLSSRQSKLQLIIRRCIGGDAVARQVAFTPPFPFPFKNNVVYKNVSALLNLPKLWPHHFRELYTVPVKVDREGPFIHIIFQTIAFSDFFVSMVLSSDTRTRTTKGVLHAVMSKYANSVLDRTLDGFARAVAHPLLLPAVLYHTLDKHYWNALIDIDWRMNAISQKNGITTLDRSDSTVAPPNKTKDDLRELHDDIVIQHKRLTSPISAAIADIGESCVSQLRNLVVAATVEDDIASDVEQLLYTTQLNDRSCLLRKQRLLAQIDVQLQITVNLIAQTTSDRALEDNKLMIQMTEDSMQMTAISTQIAVYGKRHAKLMGAISVTAFVFLPITAIAGVFSMGPFFDTGDDGIQVSHDLWIYFAITVPITLIIVLAWIIYAKHPNWRDRLIPRSSTVEDEEKAENLSSAVEDESLVQTSPPPSPEI